MIHGPERLDDSSNSFAMSAFIHSLVTSVAPTNITAEMVAQVHQPWSVQRFQGCYSQIEVDLTIRITVSWVYLLLYLSEVPGVNLTTV